MSNQITSKIRAAEHLGQHYSVDTDMLFGDPGRPSWRAAIIFRLNSETEERMAVEGRFESCERACAAGIRKAEAIIEDGLRDGRAT